MKYMLKYEISQKINIDIDMEMGKLDKNFSELSEIEYIEGNEKLIDSIAPLWTKLNEHHKANSTQFISKYENFTFEERKTSLMKKVNLGIMKINLAKDIKTNTFVGYCISTIDEENVGEIESLYVEADYRKFGIGKELMTRTLKWLDESIVLAKVIGVAAGNEQAFGFYERFGFYPSLTTLRQV